MMRNAKNSRLENHLLGEQGTFDFTGHDVFAAANDDVFDAVGYEEIAVVVQVAGIASSKPAVDRERLGICLRVVDDLPPRLVPHVELES